MFSLRTLVAASICAAAFAACGGGGGSSPTPVTSTPTPSGATATPSPSPTTTAAGTAALAYSPTLAGGNIQFSCGCATAPPAAAGTNTIAADGSSSITQNATGLPSGSGTYTTYAGRNYVVIGTGTTGLQYWTLINLGTTATASSYLGPNNGSGVDVYTTIGALYVYYNGGQPAGSSSGSEAFDYWSFSSVQAWVNHMRTPSLDAAEQKLYNDIGTAQAANTELYPSTPNWDTASSAPANMTIASDLAALYADSGDSYKPVECTTDCATSTSALARKH